MKGAVAGDLGSSMRGRLRRAVNWSGIQARMTISYVWVTAVTILIVVALFYTAVLLVVAPAAMRFVLPALSRQTAQQYAYAATIQGGVALDPQATFLPGQPGTLVPVDGRDAGVPYTSSSAFATQPIAFVLLIAPTGRVVATSYPHRYPDGGLASGMLPRTSDLLLANALRGAGGSTTEASWTAVRASAAEPVWSQDHQPIGVVYVQESEPSAILLLFGGPEPIGAVLLRLTLVVLAFTTPVGAVFGLLTTRRLVHRIQRLMLATARFADGDYAQRVAATRTDEVGQLEGSFNRMAEQLAESVKQRQALAEQNARLAERARITRELHDAISQDLFSLRMTADGLQSAIAAGSDTAVLQPRIALMAGTTATMIREMRALLLELRPTQLEHLGLVGAVEELARAYSTRLGIDVTTDLAAVSLSASAEHALLRILQEALANAARHAAATTIAVRLIVQEQTVTLTIADDGKGFRPAAAGDGEQQGLGLGLMRERTEELGGVFLLDTTPGRGTRIQVELPQEEVADGQSAHR